MSYKLEITTRKVMTWNQQKISFLGLSSNFVKKRRREELDIMNIKTEEFRHTDEKILTDIILKGKTIVITITIIHIDHNIHTAMKIITSGLP